MVEVLIELGQWFRPYQYQSALAIIATALVVFGSQINHVIRHLVRKQHVIVRSVVFILVCAFGYGLLTVWLTHILSDFLGRLSNLYVVPCVVFVFILLSVYAQRQRHI